MLSLEALLLAAICLPTAFAVGTDDQVNANINTGSFANPYKTVRPRFRYWVPDASVNLTQVAADIKDAGRVGAGGVELLGYYNYGLGEFLGSVIPSDWTQFGWGTAAWRGLQDAALRATKNNDLIIDLALGPNQGAGVPAQANADGLQWDLQPFNVTIPASGAYNGVLPGWGAGTLVSASTGLVSQTVNATTAIYKTLSTSSLSDVTTKVGSNGHLKIQLPSNPAGEGYILFAYYLVHTHYREQQSPALVIPGVPQSPITNYVQNGSWVVDHFSAKGAQTVIDFWQQNLLNGSDAAQLVKDVGNYVWEDSQEYPANIFWTKDLPNVFQSNHGYKIQKYLPILLHGNSGFSIPGSSTSTTIPIYYVTDEKDAGDSHVADYRQTLTGLNSEYLGTLTKWAQSIGIQSSAQVVYNLPMDMLANIPDVNAPETETLGFNHNIDGYKQYVGPANLAGKRIISSECGAIFYGAYQQMIPDLLWDIKRSVAGGVNNFVFHGYPYTGSYGNATWPTWTTFQYLFAEMHSRHQPGWDFYSDFMNYTARLQYVSQSGIPKRDVAFWHKQLDYSSVSTQYTPSDLLNAGYSYEYLSPDDFSLPAATVSNGVLAPTRQSFKALVVRQNDTLTTSGVAKLAQWANQGLPIVISGGIPSNISGFNETASAYVNKTFNQIRSLKNVHVVPYANLAQTLASIGVSPRAAVAKNTSGTTWYTNWREDTKKATTYVFVYNDATGVSRAASASSGNVTFATSGTPYVYDAWTGTKTAILQYSQSKNSTTIPISLAGNQTTIIAFENTPASYGSAVHAEKASTPWNSLYFSANTIANWGSKSCKLSLSNGTTVNLPANTFSPIKLQKWNLTVESWTAPAVITNIEGTVKTNTTYPISSLQAWNQIPNANLSNVSGRGYYHTTFSWPPTSGASAAANGARFELGSILHTARAYVNGHLLPPLDVTDAKAELGPYLRKGTNEIVVVVSTPLGNALIPVWYQLSSYGQPPYGPVPTEAAYGLVDEVVIRPYSGVKI